VVWPGLGAPGAFQRHLAAWGPAMRRRAAARGSRRATVDFGASQKPRRSKVLERVGLALLNADREWEEKPPVKRLSALNRPWAEHLAAAALEGMGSFDGLMWLAAELLDTHYPADLPLVCNRDSPDPGARLTAALRDCMEAMAR
jgi:hypothetical protein